MASSNDIASRAAVGFALVVAITASTIVSSAWLARSAADQREHILLQYAEDLTLASQVQAVAERIVASGRGYLLTNESEMLARVKESEAALDDTLATLDRPGASPAKRELVTMVQHAAANYRRLFDDLVRTTPVTEDRAALARALREKLQPARELLDGNIGMLVAHEKQVQEQARRRAARMAARAMWVTVGLGLGALALSSLLALSFTRRLGEIYRREQVSARKAEQALATKEELLRIVAHDLQSPLSAIVLRAASIARSSGDESLRRSATSIGATCERMANLIESLVEAATLETGRLSLSVERCSVDEVLRAILETFGPAAAAKSIRLEREVTPMGLEASADRGRLLQVLSNLVGNALKFTLPGGVVMVRATSVASRARFEVRDTGPGIAPENQSHVFDRYWRSEKHAGGGAGLGLYIAKGLVEAHGGRMWLESESGKGSAFFFEIPNPPRALVAAPRVQERPFVVIPE